MIKYNKTEVEDVVKLDSAFLNKYGYFKFSQTGKIKTIRTLQGDERVDTMGISSYIISEHMGSVNYIKLFYAVLYDTGAKFDLNYEIKLTSTPCFYGGKRWWFLCPLSKNNIACNRRVAKLYQGNKYFGCRQCHKLIYYSKRFDKRLAYHSLDKIGNVEDKIEVLAQKIKKKTYKGKLTKKQAKLESLLEVRENYCENIYQ